MRILVTGLTGFTGKYIKVELEKHGHEVIGLNANLMDHEELNLEISQILPHAVVHLAAVSFVGHKITQDFYQTNIIGTLNLLEILSKYTNNLKTILIASSANVYANSKSSLLTEISLTYPQNDYAVSKLGMEYMAKLWADRLPLFIVRPFNYTGVGQNENFIIPKIIAHFKNKSSTIELGNLNIWREFGDVRVVSEIYRKLIECMPKYQIINVCTSQTYSLRDIIDAVTEISGHQIEIKVNLEFIRENDIRELKGDNRVLKSIIKNWTVIPFKETLNWMLETEVK